jgi:uridine monophosphate synthetase
MSEVSQQTLEIVARELHKNKLIKFGEFTLKSGIVSPFYIDLRQAQSYPDTLRAVVRAYGEMLEDVDQDVFLAGVPEAATPLAAATGYKYDRRLLQPRKVVKDHGTKSSVEGAFEPGDRVVLLDDLITKGDSKIEAIDQIKAAGLTLEKFIVLIDREQGGVEMIRNRGYQIEAAITISALLGILVTDGSISEQQHNDMLEFVRNN